MAVFVCNKQGREILLSNPIQLVTEVLVQLGLFHMQYKCTILTYLLTVIWQASWWWLQLRSDSQSTAIRQRDDHFTLRPCCSGLLQCG